MMLVKVTVSLFRTLSNRKRQITKAFVPLMVVQNMSTQTSNITNQVISRNLELRTFASTTDEQEDRPVVLLLGWLLAKKRHLYKYGDVYLSRGCDVLNVRIYPDQGLVPTRAQKVMAEVLDFLSNYKSDTTPPLLLHAFSIGAYLFGECLVQAKKYPEKYHHIINRFVGQIYDSGVDFEGVPYGFAQALTHNKVLQNLIQKSIETYLTTTYNSITRHYIKSAKTFHDNPSRAPALLLYSRSDPVGTAFGNERVMRSWDKLGIEFYYKAWDKSPHVGHMHHHQEEYLAVLSAFLDRVGLPAESKIDKAGKKEAVATRGG